MFKKYTQYYKRLLNLAIPLVLTQAGQMVVHLVDNAMVGRVGTTELAAAAFANSIFMVVMVFGIGIFLGLTPIIGHAHGAKNETDVAQSIKNGLILAFFIVILLSISSWLITYFMPLMQQPTEVYTQAIPYYRLLTYSLIPFLLFIVFKQIGEGIGNTIIAMAATILSNIVNIALNYFLIFGKCGFPVMGLQGAGYATLISRIVMALLIIIGLIVSKKTKLYFKLIPKAKTSIKNIKRIFEVGFPIAIQMVFEILVFALGAIMMGWIGDVQLAAHQVAMGLASFTFMIANGVAMATTIRVSYQLGRRDFNSMESVAISAAHIVLSYMLVCGIVFLIFRNQLPRIFSPDLLVIKQAASLLIIAAAFQIFDGLQVVCLGILRGFADVKVPMVIASISYLFIGLPVSYIAAFVFNMGAEGIWFGFVIGLATAGILLALRIRKKIKKIELK
jgi:MATE family multidrug resistance protein